MAMLTHIVTIGIDRHRKVGFKTYVFILKRSDKYVFSLGMSHICLYGTLDEQLDLINGSASAP
jgi:hypothetical protein